MRERPVCADRAAQAVYGTTDMEDLWVDAFTISANMTSAAMIVHRCGPVWRAARASAALPGVAIPLLDDGDLLDLHLPGMSGIELLEHLREATPDLPVICMTGREDPEMEQRLAAAGGAPCLRKPFDQADLFMAFSKVVGDSWEER